MPVKVLMVSHLFNIVLITLYHECLMMPRHSKTIEKMILKIIFVLVTLKYDIQM